MLKGFVRLKIMKTEWTEVSVRREMDIYITPSDEFGVSSYSPNPPTMRDKVTSRGIDQYSIWREPRACNPSEPTGSSMWAPPMKARRRRGHFPAFVVMWRGEGKLVIALKIATLRIAARYGACREERGAKKGIVPGELVLVVKRLLA